MTKYEYEAFRVSFDHDNSGSVSLKDIITVLREELLSERNIELIELAYLSCGISSLDDLVNINYIETRLSGKGIINSLRINHISEEDVIKLTIEGFLVYRYNNDQLNFKSFLEYYSDLYSELRDNKIFEKLIRFTWGL
jgi:hypothetical protein